MICVLIKLFLSFTILSDLGFLFIEARVIAKKNDKYSKTCEFFNGTSDSTINNYQDCGPIQPGITSHCFVLWELNAKTKESKIQSKGCFLNNESCLNNSYCTNFNKSKNPDKQLYFCCCTGDNCNKDINFTPKFHEKVPDEVLKQNDIPVPFLSRGEIHQLIILLLTITMFTIIASLTFASWIRRRRKISVIEVSIMERGLIDKENSNPLQLLDVRAIGRFGTIWRANNLGNSMVAVKVFPEKSYKSWKNEQDVFKLPFMEHDNILKFVAAHETKDENLFSEFWLITAYHHRGSLSDYLDSNVVTWTELCKVALSIASGLAHLHEKIDTVNGSYKPSVAHRDFKSKNVLIKSDMTACIADFGLAMIFHNDKPSGNCQGRVGTIRYMAPEVLQGAINFSKNSFLAIDMYACGLVLWELVSCCIEKNDPMENYQLPFEKEVGSHPTLEDMSKHVVDKRLRPRIHDSWGRNANLSVICNTIEECWDHDADARITSSCLLDRLKKLCP